MSEEKIQQQKKGPGCFFYGCLSVVIVGVILTIIGTGIFLRVRSLVMDFTSDKPVDLPAVQMDAGRLASLDAKLNAFVIALKEDKPARLILTADEINAKINSSQEFRQMGGRAHVRIENSQIIAALSIPTDRFKLKGRYLNGTAKIRVGLEAGRLLVFVDDIDAGGKTLPDVFMKELRSTNFAEESMKNPEAAAVVAKLKSITVQEGVIVIEK